MGTTGLHADRMLRPAADTFAVIIDDDDRDDDVNGVCLRRHIR